MRNKEVLHMTSVAFVLLSLLDYMQLYRRTSQCDVGGYIT